MIQFPDVSTKGVVKARDCAYPPLSSTLTGQAQFRRTKSQEGSGITNERLHARLTSLCKSSPQR